MANRSLPNGVYTATLTPMREDFSVHIPLLVAHCNWLLNNGSDGIVLMGTTGEANSFSIRERIQTLDAIIENGLPPDRLMVGTGTCSVPETVELTRHAAGHGVGGVLLLPPYYYKQVTDGGLLQYFSSVIDTVGSDSLRIYLYHFPKMSSVSFSPGLIAVLLEEFPGIIAGMKDSTGDFEHMLRIVQEFPDLHFFAGTERHLLNILKVGGAGCISATANITSFAAGQVYAHWEDPVAAQLQDQLTALRLIFNEMPFVPILKQCLARLTNNEDWLHLRPPNAWLDEKVVETVLQELEHSISSALETPR